MTPEEVEAFIARACPDPPQAPNMISVAIGIQQQGHDAAIQEAVKQLTAWIDYRAFCEVVREMGKDL